MLLPSFFVILALLAPAVEPVEPEIAKRQTLLAEGRYGEAQAILDRLLKERTGGVALNDLAGLALPAGDYELGIAAATAARDQLQDPGQREELARAENFLGLARLYRGQYETALQHFRAALQLETQRDDRQKQAQRWINLGIVHYYQGRYDEALRAYSEAERLAAASGSAPWRQNMERLTTANLATVYQKLGQFQRALQCYRTIQSPGVRLLPREEAQILSNLGTLERRLGDVPKARELYEQAIALFRQDRNVDGEIGNLKNIGILLALDVQDFPGAERTFRESITRATAANNNRELMQCRLYLGETLFRAGRPVEAEQEWRAAAALARQLDAVEDLWRAQAGLGRALAARGDAGAGHQFLEASELLESVRGRLRATSLRSEFLAGRRELFDAWMDWTAKSNDAGQVFNIMEQARARTLRDRRRRALAGQGSESAARLQQVAGELAQLSGRQGSTPRLDRRIGALEREYLRLEETWDRESGTDRLARQVTAQEIRRRLPAGTGIVSYWISGSLIHRVTLTTGEAKYSALALSTEGRTVMEQWPRALAEDRWKPGSVLIGKLLWNDLDPKIRQWVVVADGGLGLLPFEALQNPATGRLVLEDVEIAYVPAATVWHPAETRVWRSPWSLGALALAGTGTGNRLPGDEGWQPLPAAEEEARQVARILPGRNEVRLGAEATRASLREVANRPVLHLATHAFADGQDPARSRLLLGDGYLFQAEVESLSLPWEPLVVLSACDSAAGTSNSLEGVQSLSQAFLAAGAGAAVASLWRVEDRAAAAFMERWYQKLAEGETAGAALRQVKLDFLRYGGAAAQPSRWAPFVIQGDGDWRLPRFVRWAEIALAGGLVLLAALLVLRLQRRRKQLTGG